MLGCVIIPICFPGNRIGVFADAKLGPGTGDLEAVGLSVNNACNGISICFGQRRTVIDLACTGCGDRHGFLQNLQAAGTDINLNTVVGIIGEIRQRNCIFKVRIVACIRFCNPDIPQACSCWVRGRLTLYGIPNIIQVLCLISGMTDNDIVLNTLARIGKAGLAHLTVVDLTGPPVGLNTDGDVNFLHFERAADITNGVVVAAVMSGNYGILRGNRGYARIQASGLLCGRFRIVCISIVEAQRSNAVVIQQSFDGNLVFQILRKNKRRAVVQLAPAYHRNRGFFLIIERKG